MQPFAALSSGGARPPQQQKRCQHG